MRLLFLKTDCFIHSKIDKCSFQYPKSGLFCFSDMDYIGIESGCPNTGSNQLNRNSSDVFTV